MDSLTPTIRPELLEELLKSTKKPEDILGPEVDLRTLAHRDWLLATAVEATWYIRRQGCTAGSAAPRWPRGESDVATHVDEFVWSDVDAGALSRAVELLAITPDSLGGVG